MSVHCWLGTSTVVPIMLTFYITFLNVKSVGLRWKANKKCYFCCSQGLLSKYFSSYFQWRKANPSKICFKLFVLFWNIPQCQTDVQKKCNFEWKLTRVRMFFMWFWLKIIFADFFFKFGSWFRFNIDMLWTDSEVSK